MDFIKFRIRMVIYCQNLNSNKLINRILIDADDVIEMSSRVPCSVEFSKYD